MVPYLYNQGGVLTTKLLVMKYALILLMMSLVACSKDLREDSVDINLTQPIKPLPDTILIPIPPNPWMHG